MDWISAVIACSLFAAIIMATVLMMRHREQARAASREAESLNVISNDTRRAFWFSSADQADTPDSFTTDGSDGDGD